MVFIWGVIMGMIVVVVEEVMIEVVIGVVVGIVEVFEGVGVVGIEVVLVLVRWILGVSIDRIVGRGCIN